MSIKSHKCLHWKFGTTFGWAIYDNISTKIRLRIFQTAFYIDTDEHSKATTKVLKKEANPL